MSSLTKAADETGMTVCELTVRVALGKMPPGKVLAWLDRWSEATVMWTAENGGVMADSHYGYANPKPKRKAKVGQP